MCTVCAQRLNTSVAEGHVACAVECEGVQTDQVTESDVDCEARLDTCMFKSVDPAVCRLECSTSECPKANCTQDCLKHRLDNQEADYTSTFLGKNYVKKTTVEEVTKTVDGENTTVEEEVVTKEVVGVEPLPHATTGGIVDPVPKLDWRFHSNESEWMGRVHDYCNKFYCEFSGVDSYRCVECVNRLNTSVEHGLMACRVGCEMKTTDRVSEGEKSCDQDCMTVSFDEATCSLECEAHKGASCKDCEKECTTDKAHQRESGVADADVRPFFMPAPEGNATEAEGEAAAATTAAPAEEKTDIEKALDEAEAKAAFLF